MTRRTVSWKRGATAAWATLALLFADVVELPRNGVEQSDQAGLADTATEEGICCEGAESVVSDLGVGGRSAAVDEGKVVVGREDGSV